MCLTPILKELSALRGDLYAVQSCLDSPESQANVMSPYGAFCRHTLDYSATRDSAVLVHEDDFRVSLVLLVSVNRHNKSIQRQFMNFFDWKPKLFASSFFIVGPSTIHETYRSCSAKR